MVENNLVKKTPQDELACALNEAKARQLKEKLHETYRDFDIYFPKICYARYGLQKGNLQDLSKEALLKLVGLVARRSRITGLLQRAAFHSLWLLPFSLFAFVNAVLWQSAPQALSLIERFMVTMTFSVLITMATCLISGLLVMIIEELTNRRIVSFLGSLPSKLSNTPEQICWQSYKLISKHQDRDTMFLEIARRLS